MKRQETSFMLMLLYSALILALLVLVYAGASLYSSAALSQQNNADRRSALSFVQSQAAGCRENVRLEQGSEGQILCLPEDGTDYETRIFLHEGKLRTAFVPKASPADADLGDAVCPLESFALSWQSDSLLKISADGAEGFAACRRGEVK